MTTATLPLAVINTDHFTSEEVLQKAISKLEDRRRNVNAAISVLRRKLNSVKMMSQEVSWQEFQRMKSIPCSSAHWDDVPSKEMLPLRKV
jgi:hypothetical protein